MRKEIGIHLMLLSLIVASMFTVPVFAGTTYLVESTVKSGDTCKWYPTSNTSGFYLTKNEAATLYFKLGSSESNVKYGLMNSSGSKSMFGTFSGNNTATSSQGVSSTGRYRPYVENNAANTITVKGTSYIQY